MYVKQKPFWADFYMPQVEEKVKPAAKILNSDNRMLEHFKQQQSIKFPFVG